MFPSLDRTFPRCETYREVRDKLWSYGCPLVLDNGHRVEIVYSQWPDYDLALAHYTEKYVGSSLPSAPSSLTRPRTQQP